MGHAEKRPTWIIIKAKLGFGLTCSERGKYCRWLTRKVTTPEGLNAHDVCEIEEDRDYQTSCIEPEMLAKLDQAEREGRI